MLKQIKSRRVRAPHVLTLALCAAAAVISTRPAQADPTNKWESVFALGLGYTTGNSENFLGTASITSARKWSKDEMLLGLSAGYGESTTETDNPTPPPRTLTEHNTTDQYVRGYAQWNHLFSDRFYAGIRLDGVYDDVAGIDYRFILSPLAGYYLIKKPNIFLAVEAGPSFIAEHLRGEAADQYFGLRFGDRFEYKFFEGRARIWQTASYVPQVDDFNNYVLTVEVGIGASLSKVLELRLVVYDEYDNEPAPGRKNNDLKLTAQIGYKF